MKLRTECAKKGTGKVEGRRWSRGRKINEGGGNRIRSRSDIEREERRDIESKGEKVGEAEGWADVR